MDSTTFMLLSSPVLGIPQNSSLSLPYFGSQNWGNISLNQRHDMKKSRLAITRRRTFSRTSPEDKDDGPLKTTVHLPDCPFGLRRYQTVAILRPDISDSDLHVLTLKYEKLLSEIGAVEIQVTNKGLIPMANRIKKSKTGGDFQKYTNGIYLVFTYCTGPESIKMVEEAMMFDDNIIRDMSLKYGNNPYALF